jgi:hypothetical protein
MQLAINMPEFIADKDNKKKADRYLRTVRATVC